MPLAVKKQAIVIIGPTGVGKTDLAIHLAERLDGEIISADSRYLYQGMSIGTAKPSPSQLMKIKHHLIDVADIDKPWSLAVYQREAKKVLDEITAKGKLPFLVGGTGQYVFCLSEGWKIPAQKPDYRLRKILEEWANQIGREELYRKLCILDPQAAELIDYRNMRRTIRALEVILSTGKLFSSQRQREPVNYLYVMIGLTRSRGILFQRIDQRIDQMIESGFIDEVDNLLTKGYGLQHPPMSAIGYKEIALYLNGQMDLSESIKLMKKRTRLFVRRQANWFKPTDTRIKWFDLDQIAAVKIEEYINSNRS